MGLLQAALVAFGIVFVAELGDKTQLLALGFGARHSLGRVLAGLTVGYGAAGVVAVIVGGLLGAAFPQRPIEVVGGIVFVGFAALALRNDDDDEVRRIAVASVVGTIALTILVAEMGDKTQIATAALAARGDVLGTWIGATVGEVASGMLGAAAGSLVGERIRPATLRWVSAILFATFGVAMILGAT